MPDIERERALAAGDLMEVEAIKPSEPRYRLRGGRLATQEGWYWDCSDGSMKWIWHGTLDDGTRIEWNEHYQHLGGDSSLDLVAIHR